MHGVSVQTAKVRLRFLAVNEFDAELHLKICQFKSVELMVTAHNYKLGKKYNLGILRLLWLIRLTRSQLCKTLIN